MNDVNRRVVLGGVAAAAAVSAIPAVSWADGGDGAIRPVRLTTEHVTNPLGTDAGRPRFGWQLVARGNGRSQRAYRIMVASKRDLVTAGRPDVWDSGKVTSPDQSGQAYAGIPLRSRTRYHWAVQVWDEHDKPGPVSEPAWFETAFLSTTDWKAEWIGSGLVIPPPVKTLPQFEYKTINLEPGHTLGQTFVSPSQMVALTVLLGVTGTAGCTMTLRRDGPNGTVVHSQVLSGLTPDRYGQAQGRMDFTKPVEAGRYYLELSSSVGVLGWKGLLFNAYPDGAGFADGGELKEQDHWVYSIPPPPPANPLLRNEFEVSAKVVSARLYICGLGHAIAWVNGERVGDAELTPPGTDYDRRDLYVTHDVTSLVRQGKNVVGVALGRGMFATRAPDTDGSNLARWVAEPQVKAQLEIVTADGRRSVVATGPSWQITEGPVVSEGVYTGETYDARRAEPGWSSPGYDTRGWRAAAVVPSPGGRLEAYTAEPIRASDVIRPVKVSVPANGIRLYDFGVVLAGHARVRARLPEGTTVRMLYGEKLGPDGRVNVGIPGGNENNSVEGRYQRDEYIADGSGEATWGASFTYKSFRYLEVSGTTLPVDVAAVPVSSSVASTMDIRLDNPELQWIADAFKQTAVNILRGHPDIGRFGWTSGSYRAAQPMLYQFGMAAFFEKWLEDIRLSQAPSGEIPLVAPMGAVANGGLLTPSSTGVYPYLVHRHWLTYGDKTVPAKHFDAVRRYVSWLLGMMKDGIADDRFGDWYPPNPGETPMAPEGGTLVGTAYVIETLRSAIAIASVLGRTEQARAWQARADEITRQFNAAFLDVSAGLYRTSQPAGYRQTSNAVPLAFGLVPRAVTDRVAENLATEVEKKGRHLDTGALGTGALPFALSDHGRPDLATAVLTQTTYPSYGYLRSLGATTFWESWEANSRAHQDPTLSMPVQWLVERAAGVSLVEPGWARFRVAPTIHGSLPGARVALDTVRGRIEAGWQRRGDGVVVDVRVPVNSVAEVVLPNGVRRELGSGVHRVQ